MSLSFDAGYLQAQRILRIESPLGADVLLPERMEVHEQISGLFEIAVALRSKRPDLKADEIVGRLVDVSLEAGDGDRRPWNGLVTELLEGPAITRGLRSYRLTIRPKLWLLSQRSDCRIWQDKTSLEVLATLLSEHGVEAPVTSGVVDAPAPQAYSVQYNETDLAYLTRRLEADGVFFWFEHEPGRHVLHAATYATGYTEGPQTDVRLAAGSTDRNHITRFEKRYLFTPGRRAGADWNFETPRSVPLADTPSLVALNTNRDYELYEYPSKALDARASETASKLRMQSVEVDHERIEGGSTVRTLAPGRRFKPYDVAHPDQTYEEHVVTAIVHDAVDRSYETNDDEPRYRNSFVALPSRLPATPHRATPRPRIDGAQVAVVAGPPGEEIFPDQYGRIKVWFPWDRRRKKDGSDTCWIRVMQSWAGGAWGAQVIPRIGMEVMISYLEGDPDRPVVTGVVPNPDNRVPYKLPEHKTRSVFKTQTHKGYGFNELRFEDEKGREEVYMHAEKDMSVHVQNNHATRIDNNRAESIGNNNSITTANIFSHTVGGDMNLLVGWTPYTDFATRMFDIKSSVVGTIAAGLKDFATSYRGIGNFNVSVANCKTETVSFSSTEVVGVAKATTVSGAYEINVGGNKSVSIGGCAWTEVGVSHSMLIGERYEIVCGKTRLIMTADGKIEIQGEELHFNGNSIISLIGKKIALN